jgi:hypothetical protein
MKEIKGVTQFVRIARFGWELKEVGIQIY